MDETIVLAANDLIKVIKNALDPSSDNHQRSYAYQLHEEFKQTSPICSEVGFYIFDKQLNLDISIRLCGLQLVEWFILNNWDKVDANWRNNMKLKCLQLIESADFSENKCIKEAVVKIIVEVIKRSWPQEWSSLFSDLSNLHKQGDAQLELVLIVLMRLSEDINPINGLDQKVKQQRRKDMVITLNKEILSLLKFFITTIHDRTLKLKENNTPEHLQIITASLYTITEYATWVKFMYLFAEEKLLFKVLFWLLEYDQMKYNAAHCLCCIFERKTDFEKRVELLIILSDDALDIVEKVANKCAAQAASNDEDEYNSLKKLSQMVASFGINQIATLWGEDRGIKERPQCFDRFLKIMIDFTKHASLVIILQTLKIWQAFCQNPEISKDEMFLSALQLLPEDLLRCGSMRLASPQYSKHPGNMYSVMDFDEEGEFKQTCNEARLKVQIIHHKIVDAYPHFALQFVMEKGKQALSDLPDLKGVSAAKILSTTHFIVFESFLAFSKDFFVSFLQKSFDVMTHDGLCQSNIFLQLLIDCPCPNPVYMKHIIMTMEHLFPVFVHSRELMVPTIQKLSSLMRSPTAEYDDKSQRKLKRTSVTVLAHLLKRKSELFVDNFDDLHSLLNLKISEGIFSNFEKALLIEGLLCVSKLLKDTEKMKLFVEEVFRYPISILNRDDVKQALSNTSSFINFLALDENNITEPVIQRKRDFNMALATLQTALRAFSTEEEVHDNPSASDITAVASRYPGFQLLIDALPHVFDVAKQACLLWTKVGDFSSTFKEALEPYYKEVYVPGAKDDPPGDDEDGDGQTRKDHKQFLVYNLHEVTFHTLSLYGRCLGPVFFSLPGMMDVFIEKVVSSWVHLPNYRYKYVCKEIVKSFSRQCPAKYYGTVIGPFLTVIIEQVFERFTKEWQRIKQMEESQKSTKNKDEDENDQSPEIIERRVMYGLSREVFTVLVNLFRFKRGVTNPDLTIGQLGEFLLTYQGTNLKLVTLLLSAFTWPDSTVINQVSSVINPIVQKMFVPECPVNADIPNQVILQLLQGLQIHGSEPSIASNLVNTLFLTYVRLREQYPGIVHVIMMVPTCTEEELKKFDLMMFVEQNNFNETTKQKRFRKLIEGAIGKTVSELHKANLKIQDLVPLTPRVKPKTPDVIADTEDAGLCQLFNPDETKVAVC